MRTLPPNGTNANEEDDDDDLSVTIGPSSTY